MKNELILYEGGGFMTYKTNEETLEFLEKLNNYFREKLGNSDYQFTALPLSSKHDDIDDKIEFSFHKYIDVNAKFNSKVEDDLERIKELILNSEYSDAVYLASIYGESHRHFSFAISNQFLK